MSGDENLFEALDSIFGRARGVTSDDGAMDAVVERARYQESLMTELLITLAGKGVLTNGDAREVIRKAKERTVKKDTEESAKHNCPCPIHDKRPHKALDCARCGLVVPHLIESDTTARCRACLTPRSV
jgi:hypothetical protein